MEPDRIWWDNAMLSRIPFKSAEAQYLLNYLEVVFHLQFGFYIPRDSTPHSSSKRSWLYQTLCENEPLYQISLALSISLEAGKAADGNTSGYCLATERVRTLHNKAIRGVQPRLDMIAKKGINSSASSVIEIVRTLAVVMKLISLELFNHVGGAWQMHLEAGGRILGMLQHYNKDDSCSPESKSDYIADLIRQPVSTEQGGLLKLFATSFAWLDIVSQSAHGAAFGRSNTFYDYIPLLETNFLDIRNVMGCDSSVWLAVSQIVRLEADMESHSVSTGGLGLEALPPRVSHIEDNLRAIIFAEQDAISQTPPRQNFNDSQAITLIHAFAALVYLYAAVSGYSTEHPKVQENVATCLDMLERLPTRLFIRVNWPFTIAGCMATGSEQQERFRALIWRTEKERQVLGLTWKGMMVMETCWSLRQKTGVVCSWRYAMEVMRERILLL